MIKQSDVSRPRAATPEGHPGARSDAVPGDRPGTQRVDPQARQEMIAVAAYYCAQRRGFEPGCELDDWIQAEAQVDALLAQPSAGARSAGAAGSTR